MAETPKNSEPSKRTESWWSKNWFYITLVLVAVIGGGCAFTLPYHFQREGDNIWSLRQAILAATGGVLAILTLWENRRKNIQEKEKNDQDHTRQVHAERRSRYAKAVEQLADEKAPIRLGGVYTLVKLIDEWLADEKTLPNEEERREEGQVIVNSLCAYIRSPFDLASRAKVLSQDQTPENYEGRDQQFTKDPARFREEKELRLTILSEIKKRLTGGIRIHKDGSQEILKGLWSDFNYDFSNTVFFYPVSFSNSYFGASSNFSRVKFTKDADFSGVKFTKGADFSEAEFTRSNFSGAKFTKGADFSEAEFTRSNFSGAKFTKGADFSEAEFTGTDFFRAEFTRSNFFRVKFTGTDFSRAKFTKDTNFSEAEFTRSNFSGAEFTRSNFSGAEFAEADFFGAEFAEADFSWAKFAEADFSWAEFTKASFSGAEFTGIANFSNAKFTKGADFSLVKFTEADFSWVKFTGIAHFSETEFTGIAHFLEAAFENKPIFEYTLGNKIYKARFSCKVALEDYNFKVSHNSPYIIETEEKEYNGIKFTIPKGAILFDPDEHSGQKFPNNT